MITDLFNSDASSCGSKAENLTKLYHSGFNVPPGCVVPIEYFLKHLEKSNAGIEVVILNNMLLSSSIKQKEIDERASNICRLIEDTPLCINLKNEIEDFVLNRCWHNLAIRSSSVAEDTSNQSWAGQYDSFLNAKIEDIPVLLKKCWASTFSERAIAYYRMGNVDVAWPSMAVIIQKMVPSCVSGVGFSVHPVTGNSNHVLIEAVKGLGEQLVSGKNNPEHFVVDCVSGSVIESRSASRDNNTICSLLSDHQIRELCSIIKSVEQLQNFASDIEWSISDDKIYLLQARPITVQTQFFEEQVNTNTRKLMVSHQSDLLTQDVVLSGVQKYCDFRKFGISFPYPYIRYEHGSGDISYPITQVREFEKAILSIEELEGLVNFLSQELNSYEDYLNEFSLASFHGHQQGLIKKFFDKTLKSAATIPYFICFEIIVSKIMISNGYELSQVKSSSTATGEANEYLYSLRKKYEIEINLYSDKNGFPSQMTEDLDIFCQKYGYLGMLYFKGMPWTSIDAFRMLLSAPAGNEPHNFVNYPESPILKIASQLLTLRTRKWEVMCRGGSIFRSHVIKHFGKKIDYDNLLKMRIQQVCAILDGGVNPKNILTVNYPFALEITDDDVVISKLTNNTPINEEHTSCIKGICANRGLVSGVARVVLSARDFESFSQGDILITKMSTPDFLPLMRLASAFVTEIGGVTSHAAILSRELGVPCVIGARNVTSIIKDGDFVLVNASVGQIFVCNDR